MFSPRSSNYERLEGGHGPSRMGTGMRRLFGWKKFVIGAVVLITLVWMFGPRSEDLLPEGYYPPFSKPGGAEDIDLEPPPLHETRPTTTAAPLPALPPAPQPPSQNENEDIAAPIPRPTSSSSDPDRSKTVYCTSPFKPDLPLVQYALMIDAGSTGSRIHVYKFNNCGASPQYEYEHFKQINPGLSSYEGRPMDAAASLDVLLDEAMEVVPAQLRSCAPVAVKATAGLRAIGVNAATEILDTVRKRLQDKYPFPIAAKDGVVIMDGSEEGVFAWITANYLLNTIRSDSPASLPPYAVLDLGGGSTQIVFEPTFDMSKPDSTLESGEHKYELKFGGKDHTLYQHSYLGYGLMSARKSVHRLVDFMGSFYGGSTNATAEVANPCLARGTKRVVEVTDERVGEARNVTMVGADVGSFEACNRVVELVMAKDAVCEVKPCSFNGVYQPSLLDTFPNGKILLLSYFYDRLRPLLGDSSSPIHIYSIADLAKKICLGKPSWEEYWGEDKSLMEDIEGRPEYCLDLTFMHALLRLGYEFSSERVVELGKQIEGTELGWCLGATLAMVGGDLKCKA